MLFLFPIFFFFLSVPFQRYCTSLILRKLRCDLLKNHNTEENLSGIVQTMAHVLPDLAAQVSSAAAVINDFLVSNGYQQPSFNVDAPPAFPSAPTEIINARRQMLDAAQEIVDLAVGPAEHLRWLACRVRRDHWLYRFVGTGGACMLNS